MRIVESETSFGLFLIGSAGGFLETRSDRFTGIVAIDDHRRKLYEDFIKPFDRQLAKLINKEEKTL